MLCQSSTRYSTAVLTGTAQSTPTGCWPGQPRCSPTPSWRRTSAQVSQLVIVIIVIIIIIIIIIPPVFTAQLTVEKVWKELSYFKREPASSFERTYGWAWLLKLQEELLKLNPDWSDILQPLVQHIVQIWTAFLPNLVYPVRVGEHTNTAFGLSFAVDFARHVILNKILFGKCRVHALVHL